MKKAPLYGLIYHEYYLGKKRIKISMFVAIALSFFCILLLLSFQYGNLALIEETRKEAFKSIFLLYGKYGPIIVFSQFPECLIEVFINTDCEKWRQFRLVSPVSGFRFAAARYLMITTLSLIALAMGAGYNVLFCTLFSIPVTVGSWGIVFLTLAGVIVMGVLIQIYGILFHSVEKAGIALLLTLIAPIGLFVFFKKDERGAIDFSNQLQFVENLGVRVLPFAVLILVLALLLGFLLTGLLYQRKEK